MKGAFRFPLYKGGNPAIICPENGYILPEQCVDNGYILPEQCVDNGYIEDKPGAGSWVLAAFFFTNASSDFTPMVSSPYNPDSDFAWIIGESEYNYQNLAGIDIPEIDGSTQLIELYVRNNPSITVLNFNGNHIIGRVNLVNEAFDDLTQIYISDNSELTGIVIPDTHSGTLGVFDGNKCNLSGILDLSMITAWGTSGHIDVSDNPNLKNINFAASVTGTMSNLTFDHSDITGILDLSMFTAFSTFTRIYGNNNSNLTGIKFASSVTGTINSLFLQSCNITGTLDLSMFSSYTYNASIDVNNNNNLTEIIWPASVSGTMYKIDMSVCNLQGNVDISMFNNWTGTATIYANSNPNMTGFKISSSFSGTLSRLYLGNCNITGTLDLSMLTAYGNNAILSLGENSNLTAITWPASITLGYMNNIDISSTGLTNLDISLFNAFYASGATLNIDHNPSLTSLTMATGISGKVRYFRANYNSSSAFPSPTNFNSGGADASYSMWYVDNNNWTAAQVNQYLTELDSLSGSGISGRRLYIYGSNAAPDSSSGGYDGLTAKSNLEAKGWTVYANS